MSLGLTSLAACLLPIIGGGLFIGHRKRMKLQWREELMDPDGGMYDSATESDLKYFRKVRAVEDYDTHQYQSAGGKVERTETHGIKPIERMFSPLETQALLEDAADWAKRYGQPLEMTMASHAELVCTPKDAETYIASLHTSDAQSAVRRIVSAMQGKIAAVKDRSIGLFGENRVVSDHAVDARVMKAPWGCGDAMQMDKLPLTLRWALKRVAKECPRVGALRHVFLEYSPNGVFCRAPSCPPGFDGHDYVIIPLTEMGKTPTVLTFSPLLRSRNAHSVETLVNSWTTRDIDVLVPGGGAVRVVGEARYFWGWGIRPFQWFGTCGNTLEHYSLDHPGDDAKQNHNSWVRKLVSFWNQRGRPTASELTPTTSGKASALLVLHFEGPRSSDKQRSRWSHPEVFVYGNPPTPDEFDFWASTDMPTAKDVYDGYILLFMIRNYWQMLNS